MPAQSETSPRQPGCTVSPKTAWILTYAVSVDPEYLPLRRPSVPNFNSSFAAPGAMFAGCR